MEAMETPHAVQLVTVEDDHSYHLNEQELEKILLREDIKDLPVAVVSLVGAYRTGKSFMLNFLLRYLSSSPTARSDGTWIGDDSTELTGFSWRGGSERNTTGILMWSEPFVITIPSGEKVAVLLMDTQGTFDSTSTIRDCSTIFALSSLLSSTQIYNIKSHITEGDLQNLQLFIDYGKLTKDQSGKPFQILEFLIRDWMNPWEYNYGQEGGEQYVAKKFKIEPSQPLELRELRQHILESFEKVTGFLMPHPGLLVGRKKFKGKPSEISEEFNSELKVLAASIFSAEKLCMKQINGQPMKSRELLNVFKSYMTIFNSDDIPSPTNILKVTSNAGLLITSNQIKEQFEKNMDLACGMAASSMPEVYVIYLHHQEMATAYATFKAKKLLGDPVDINKKLDELMQELADRKNQFIEINILKTMKAIKNGNAAYDTAIEDVTKGKPLCVHAIDLDVIHGKAVEAALKAFNNNRKIRPDGLDADRDKFIKDLEEKKESLRLKNDHNNKLMVGELKLEYMEYIMRKANSEPNLCESSLASEHEQAKTKACVDFESRRNLPNSYTADVYKTTMLQDMELQYFQAQITNRRSNDELFQTALKEFYAVSTKLSELRRYCLHPSHLKEKHQDAKRLVLRMISPNQLCGSNYTILMQRMQNHYEQMETINDSANRQAVSYAYWVFRDEYDSHKSWTWAFVSWNTARKYYYEGLELARREFYQHRGDSSIYEYSHSNVRYDPYDSDLQSKCEAYYKDS